jgi:hypothetical protein
MMVNPFRPVQLGASVALSTVLSGGVSTLPPGNFADVARALVGFCGVALSTKVVCETLVDDANAESTAQENEVQAALTRDLYRANAAYYREYPHHWKARQPVPDQWLELWGQTGGKPYLALHPSSPQAFAPVAPIAQTQPQPQTIQEPGQTRGGSFDRADDFAPVRPPAPTLSTYSPPAQSSIAQVEYTPRLFDWQSFVTNPDLFPHVCVLGSTGNGKTSLQEWLARLIGSGNELVILTTKKKGMQWHGLPITGLGRDFAPISQKWRSIEAALNTRCADLDLAQSQPQIICAIDELNDIIANSDLDLANVARAGREARLRLIVNSHSEGVDGLGLKGKNDIKACFVWVRLGQFAINHAQMLSNKGLIENADIAWLKAQQRPCMVGDMVAQVPALPEGWQGNLNGSQRQPPTPHHQTPEPQSSPSFEPLTPPVVQGSDFGLNRLEPPRIAPSPAPEPPTDREAELLSQFAEFKALGMNKAQICFALWGAKKGGTDRYRMASDFYDRLNSIYSQNSGDNAA